MNILNYTNNLVEEVDLDDSVFLYFEEIDRNLELVSYNEAIALENFICEVLEDPELSIEEALAMIEEAFIKSMRKGFAQTGGKVSYKNVRGKNRDKSDKNFRDLKSHEIKSASDRVGQAIGRAGRRVVNIPKNMRDIGRMISGAALTGIGKREQDSKKTASGTRQAMRGLSGLLKRKGKMTDDIKNQFRSANKAIKKEIGGVKGSGKADKARSTINRSAVDHIKKSAAKLAKLRTMMNAKGATSGEKANAKRIYDRLIKNKKK